MPGVKESLTVAVTAAMVPHYVITLSHGGAMTNVSLTLGKLHS